jgi:hypothetical protein
VLSETAAPPPPVAGAPFGTAVVLTGGAEASLLGLPVAYSPVALLLGLPVAYSPVALLLGLPVAYAVGFGESLMHGGGVTQVDGAAALAEAAVVGLALDEPEPMVMPGIEAPGAMFMPGIEAPGATFVPELDDEDEELEPALLELDLGGVHGGGVTQVDGAAALDDVASLDGFAELIMLVLLEAEVLFAVGFGESLVHGGAVTQVDGAAAEDAAALGLVVAEAVAVAVALGVDVTGATVVVGAPPIGTPSGGAPAGGTPAPAVEDVESLPAFRPISDSTTARSTIATSAPITQAVLFGLSLSEPDWSSDVESVGVSDMFSPVGEPY